MKKNNQSGQTLVMGLAFLTISLFSFWLFFTFFQVNNKVYTQEIADIQKSIKKLSFLSNALNKISFNNSQILQALQTWQSNEFYKIEGELSIAYTQPFWETGWNFLINKSALSNDTKKQIRSFEASTVPTSRRALSLAITLTQENKNLQTLLAQNGIPFVETWDTARTFCLALERNPSENLKEKGFFNAVPYDNFHDIYLKKVNCTIKTSLRKNKFATLFRDLTSFTKSDPRWDLDHDLRIQSLPIHFFSTNPHKIQTFLRTAKLQTRSAVLRITHPLLRCNNASRQLLAESDWQQQLSCPLWEDFTNVFLTPQWTALATQFGPLLTKK